MKIVRKLKIIKNENKTICVFCKKKIEGNYCIGFSLNDVLDSNYQYTQMDVHLGCAYAILKNYKNPSEEEIKLIKDLENKYKKEMILEEL
jgi:hypothetical protein